MKFYLGVSEFQSAFFLKNWFCALKKWKAWTKKALSTEASTTKKVKKH